MDPNLLVRSMNYFFTNDHIQDIKPPPYCPKDNDKVEAAVKVCKNMLKKAEDFDLAMLNYCDTPPQGHSYSPALRVMDHTTLPSLIQMLLPATVNRDEVIREISGWCEHSKFAYNHNAGPKHTPPNIGNYVNAKPLTQWNKSWAYGQVIKENWN